uniref:Uncharacterized protein n=1 Tax=Gasterosteus aculeatus TaxID=69293 RepID=G3PWW4_GASAC
MCFESGHQRSIPTQCEDLIFVLDPPPSLAPVSTSPSKPAEEHGYLCCEKDRQTAPPVGNLTRTFKPVNYCESPESRRSRPTPFFFCVCSSFQMTAPGSRGSYFSLRPYRGLRLSP